MDRDLGSVVVLWVGVLCVVVLRGAAFFAVVFFAVVFFVVVFLVGVVALVWLLRCALVVSFCMDVMLVSAARLVLYVLLVVIICLFVDSRLKRNFLVLFFSSTNRFVVMVCNFL